MGICSVTKGAQPSALGQPREVGGGWWDGAGDRSWVQEGGDICIPTADSCCCMAETNTIL